MTYSWLATEALTGKILTDLPDFVCDKVADTIGSYESASGYLPLPTAPVDWERATLPMATVFVLVDNRDDDPELEDTTPVPVWGGMILDRERITGDELPISLATLPAYFDRRFVGNVKYTQAPQTAIMRELLTQYVLQGSNGGIPMRLQMVGPESTVRRDREYMDADDKSVYSVLQELSDVIDGPEWYVGWEYLHNPERITPVLFYGDRVGSVARAGMAPAATFEIPGPVSQASVVEDYRSDRGANDVMAVSSASADVRPQSVHVVTPDPQRPTIEFRFTPSTSITNVSTLNDHARSRSKRMSQGTTSLSLTAVLEDAPRLGIDWNTGDDVGFVIGGTDRYGRETVPAFPGGRVGTARAIGWQLDFGSVIQVTPILAGGS